jgi:hypothetical protein
MSQRDRGERTKGFGLLARQFAAKARIAAIAMRPCKNQELCTK